MDNRILSKILDYGGAAEGLFLEGDGMYLKDFNFKKVTANRNKKSYSKEVLKAISNVSNKLTDLHPFGSWTYRSQIYPGDIDLIEEISHCCSREAATKKFVKITQNVIAKIMSRKGVYIGDIKTGIDRAFLIDIGHLRYTPQGYWHIIDYNPKKIHFQIDGLYEEGFITKSEYDKFIKLSPTHINNKQFEILRSELREKWLLRWTPKEIAQGYKELLPNRRYSLARSLNDPIMFKLDTWTQINGKYLEVSNIMIFFYTDKKGIKHLMNYREWDGTDYVPAELRKDVQILAFSPNAYKPFKALKRMWSIARIEGDKEVVRKLTPIMQTDLGRLAQINSELEVMLLIFKNVKVPPIDKIKKQLDDIKYKLQNVYELPIDMNKMIELFDSFQYKNKDTLPPMLKELRDFFKSKIDKGTVEEMTKVGLWPPPQNYLPKGSDYSLLKGQKLLKKVTD